MTAEPQQRQSLLVVVMIGLMCWFTVSACSNVEDTLLSQKVYDPLERPRCLDCLLVFCTLWTIVDTYELYQRTNSVQKASPPKKQHQPPWRTTPRTNQLRSPALDKASGRYSRDVEFAVATANSTSRGIYDLSK